MRPTFRLFAVLAVGSFISGCNCDGDAMADGGTPGTDGGSTTFDAGQPKLDAGVMPVDAGTQPVDAGTPPVDAGTPLVDAGTPFDAGTTEEDAGTPPVDAGTVEDAGITIDAGLPPEDAGVDSGTPVVDAGAPPIAISVDAGADSHWLLGKRYELSGLVTVDGGTATIAWSQTAGPAAQFDADAGAQVSAFTPRAAGVYTFTLAASAGATVVSASTTISVHDINGGESFSLALKPDGTLWSWGSNFSGSLGDGTTTDRDVAGRVCDSDQTDCVAHPLTGVVAIATGRGQALALKADGTVWSWGENNVGQLGDGTFTQRHTPHHVCSVDAVSTDGGTEPDCVAYPLEGVKSVVAGYLHSVALKNDGTLVAWGYNYDAELGNGSTSGYFPLPGYVCAVGATAPCSPANSNILTGVRQVTAGGGGHTIAMLDDGSVVSFGHNKSGQCGIGDGMVREISIPQLVCAAGQTSPCAAFLSGVVTLDAWSGHSLALDASGQLWGFGGNDDNELGMVTTMGCLSASTCSPSPAPVCTNATNPCTAPLTNVRTFAAGRKFSLASFTDGTVRAWGNNDFGQLGRGQIGMGNNVPTLVCGQAETDPCATSLGNVAAVSAGSYHAFALTRTGGLYAWGENATGQLGDGDTNHAQKSAPVVVVGY